MTSRRYTTPNSVSLYSRDVPHSWVSFNTLLIVYAMIEPRMCLPEEPREGGDEVDCVAVVDQAIAQLRQRGRLTYRPKYSEAVIWGNSSSET